MTTLISLPGLAEQINDHHRQCEADMNAGLQHALEAGRLLVEAKDQCKHGTWLKWLEANFKGSPRTAQLYVKVASTPAVVEKAQHVAHLSFRRAIKEAIVRKNREPTMSAAAHPVVPVNSQLPRNKPEANDELRTRVEEVAAEHPEFDEMRRAIVACYAERERINDDYCRCQDTIERLESDLRAAAKSWCMLHPDERPPRLTIRSFFSELFETKEPAA